MGFGLFGKLPQKRDYLALQVPRAILEPFETWLQSAVAASRNMMGDAWQAQYLVAPIWRFWIGAEIMGRTCAGALMPSVDGVGRFFPLSILHYCEEGEVFAPPLFGAQDGWYEALERRLLSVLDPESGMTVDRLLHDLPLPDTGASPPGPSPMRLKRGLVWAGEEEAGTLMAALHESELWELASGRSYWWAAATAGGSIVYAGAGMPDPAFYANMIRGAVE